MKTLFLVVTLSCISFAALSATNITCIARLNDETKIMTPITNELGTESLAAEIGRYGFTATQQGQQLNLAILNDWSYPVVSISPIPTEAVPATLVTQGIDDIASINCNLIR